MNRRELAEAIFIHNISGQNLRGGPKYEAEFAIRCADVFEQVYKDNTTNAEKLQIARQKGRTHG